MNALARIPVPVRVGAAGTLLAAVAVGAWQALAAGTGAGLGSAAAILLAGAVVGLALSLPGKSPEGLLLGIGIPVAAMMTWTHLDKPRYVWAVEGVLTLAALAWTYPWWREWREVIRLGAFWLTVPIWFYSMIALAYVALSEPHRAMTVGAQRLAYGGYALAVALLVYQGIRRRGRDLSIGFAAGLLLCQAALLVLGCRYVFVTGYHYVSLSAWGNGMADRFWGGPWLLYHPNSVARIAVIAALRIVPDPRFRLWQRAGTLATTGFLLVLAQSRTGYGVALVGFAVYALVYLWRHGLPRFRFWTWLAGPDRRRVLARAVAPALAVLLAFGLSGGPNLLFKVRYDTPNSGITSGRVEVLERILADYRHASVAEKIFGDGDNARGYLVRIKNPRDPNYKIQPKWTGDNAPIVMLRRGGLVGFLSFIVALGVILWRVLRRSAPIWMPAAVLGMLAGVLTEEDAVGTTPAWLILLLAEAWMFTSRWRRDSGDGLAAAMPGTRPLAPTTR